MEEGEVPLDLRNNYDLHFKKPQAKSPMDGVRDEIASLPVATALKTIRKMYGMRMLPDQTPAFELAEGARVTGIEFPAKYQGEWALGWHDGAKKSVPFDLIRLEPPPSNEVKPGGASTMTAVAKWRFAPKSKDGQWLKFDKGETISNISCELFHVYARELTLTMRIRGISGPLVLVGHKLQGEMGHFPSVLHRLEHGERARFVQEGEHQ